MHEALLIPEILGIILEFLYDTSAVQRSRKDVVNLAVTCKRISELVLDFLWKYTNNFLPLIHCLPNDVANYILGEINRPSPLEEKYRGSSGRPTRSNAPSGRLQHSEFARLDYYAAKILHIKYSPSHRTVYAGLAIIRNFYNWSPAQGLFPHLLSLRFSCLGQHPDYNIFITPSLKEVTIEWDTENEDYANQLLDKLAELSPPIEILNMGEAHGLKSIQSAKFSDLVTKLGPELRALVCGRRTLTLACLTNLSTLTHLRKLHLCNPSRDVVQASNQSDRHFFPALQDLSLKVSNFDDLVSILSRLSFQQLVSLVIYAEVQVPEPYAIDKFLAELQKRASPSFSVLRVTQRTKGTARQLSSAVITSSTLKPLLQFHSLRTVELLLHCKFSIDDADIKLMATSWPNLRVLQLGTAMGWGCPSGVSLEGLLPLLESCRELEKLGIVFDTAFRPPTDGVIASITDKQTNHLVTYLQVGDSAVKRTHIRLVAKFLITAFPKLTGIGGSWLYTSSSDSDNWNEGWSNVMKIIQDSNNRGNDHKSHSRRQAQ